MKKKYFCMKDNYFKDMLQKFVFMKLNFPFILVSLHLFVLCRKPASKFGNAWGESISVAFSSKQFVN